MSWLKVQITEHWKTTTMGAALSVFLSVFLSFVLFAPQLFPQWLLLVAAFAAIGGAQALGVVAHDSKKEAEK